MLGHVGEHCLPNTYYHILPVVTHGSRWRQDLTPKHSETVRITQLCFFLGQARFAFLEVHPPSHDPKRPKTIDITSHQYNTRLQFTLRCIISILFVYVYIIHTRFMEIEHNLTRCGHPGCITDQTGKMEPVTILRIRWYCQHVPSELVQKNISKNGRSCNVEPSELVCSRTKRLCGSSFLALSGPSARA